MVTIKDVTALYGKDVFTTKGQYAGKIEDVEADLNRFRLRAIIVDAARGSFLASMVGGKKGVIIPFQMVQATGDIVLIKHMSGPVGDFAEEQMA